MLRSRVEGREEAGKRIGAAHNTVTSWVNGTRTSTITHRPKLLELYGIPVDAWNDDDDDIEYEADDDAGPQSSSWQLDTVEMADIGATITDPAYRVVFEDALRVMQSPEWPTLSASKQSKVRGDIIRIMAHSGRSQGEGRELSPTRLKGSAAFSQLRDTIHDALAEPFPEAYAALMEAPAKVA